MVCLSETWLHSDQIDETLEMKGYQLHTNSAGNGRGLATYYRSSKFEHLCDVKESTFQLTKLTSDTVDVISIYRSTGAKHDALSAHLFNLFDPLKTAVLCGDLNICFKADRKSKLIQSLEAHGFEQFVKEATHIQGGLLDHAYVLKANNSVEVDVSLYSPYYCAKDHDALLIHLEL